MTKITRTAPVILAVAALAACGGSEIAPVAPVTAGHSAEPAPAPAPTALVAPTTTLAAAAADDPCANASPAIKSATDARYRAMVSAVLEQFLEKNVLTADYDIEGRDNPEFLHGTVANAKQSLAGLKCTDPAAGAAMEPRVTKWIADTEAAVDAQQRCRVDAACGSARAQKLFCATAADLRRQKAAEAAATARRPAGSVPECVRHGECHDRVADLKSQMQSLQAQYTRLTRKDLTERACKP